ncbi:hypothetical protein PR048_024999, partial [Dryococelus australis]
MATGPSFLTYCRPAESGSPAGQRGAPVSRLALTSANYWGQGDFQHQIEFSRWTKENSRLRLNSAFYFEVNDKRIRVCKDYFKKMLHINKNSYRKEKKRREVSSQMITTITREVDEIIKDGIRRQTKSIQKVKSHYVRSKLSHHYIVGGRSIADLYRDYVHECKNSSDGHEHPFGNYVMYHIKFPQEFDIAFFYIEESPVRNIEKHIIEKDLSRIEKSKDKEQVNDKFIVMCYYTYRTCFLVQEAKCHFFIIICELTKYSTSCDVWHEGGGNRGSSETGSCVLKFIEEKTLSRENDIEIIYAVLKYPVKAVTHKFLIKRHSQNEEDNVNSMIEKQVKKSLKSGPMQHPSHGNPYKVNKLRHDFFHLKELSSKEGSNFKKNTGNKVVKMSDIKIIRVQKDDPFTLKYTISYQECHPFKKNTGNQVVKMSDIKIIRVQKDDPFTLKGEYACTRASGGVSPPPVARNSDYCRQSVPVRYVYTITSFDSDRFTTEVLGDGRTSNMTVLTVMTTNMVDGTDQHGRPVCDVYQWRTAPINMAVNRTCDVNQYGGRLLYPVRDVMPQSRHDPTTFIIVCIMPTRHIGRARATLQEKGTEKLMRCQQSDLCQKTGRRKEHKSVAGRVLTSLLHSQIRGKMPNSVTSPTRETLKHHSACVEPIKKTYSVFWTSEASLVQAASFPRQETYNTASPLLDIRRTRRSSVRFRTESVVGVHSVGCKIDSSGKLR